MKRFCVLSRGAAITLLGCSGLIHAQSAPAAASTTAQTATAQAPPPAAAPAAASTPAAPAAPAAPAPLPTPAMTGPLAQQPPATLDAGPLGKISVNGIVSGMGMLQGNHFAGDSVGDAALSNAQIFIQKTDGWFQFYIQAGAYTVPDLATPFINTAQSMSDFWGAVPVAYVKLQAGKNTSFEIGSLPTLMGAESTFSFQNMNIERGLLWNQENAVNRGVQINQTMGKFTASISWNDGYYSNRYTWLSGALTYTNGPHSLAFDAMGNLGQTAFQNLATPVQNNGSMYAVIYTYTKGAWIVQPYLQFSSVPTNPAIGVAKGASTTGGAILLSRTFKHGFSLPLRWEYIASSGSAADQAVNLLFGPGSAGTSFTVTPTYQAGGFFVRGDLGFVHASSIAPGSGFGPLGMSQNQPRAVVEMGFLFGNNITEH
jgi:hypothetical protein